MSVNSTITHPRKPAAERQESKRAEASRVFRELDILCSAVGLGGRLPRHTELMRRLSASERNVIRALEELQRQGRITRRHGSGTFVTEPGSVSPALPAVSVAGNCREILAIARPDGSVFDRCIELLYEQAAAADLELTCRFLRADRESAITPESLGQPQGIIVFQRDLAPLAKQLLNAGHRVVIVGSPHMNQTFDVPCVCANHEHGGYLIARHLIALGHRHIAYSSADRQLPLHWRWHGHQKAIAEAKRDGIDVEYQIVSDDLLRAWRHRPDQAAAYLREIVPSPTAFVLWNDPQAAEVLGTFTRAGIAVPEEVSLVGYDNMAEAQFLHPPLTTVEQGLNEQVAAAVDLITRPAVPPANTMILFSGTLVPRESTGPPPTNHSLTDHAQGETYHAYPSPKPNRLHAH